MSNTEPTEAEIEAIRRAAVKTAVEQLMAEGAVIAHPTVRARLERDLPGFDYNAKLDNFRAVIDDSFPADPIAPVVGTVAAVESVDELGAPVVQENVLPLQPEPDEMTDMDIEQLREAIHQGEMDRGDIKSQLYAAVAARTTARTILGQCIQTLISGRPVMTPTQVAQSFCQAAVAERQAAQDQGRGAHPAHAVHHRSKLDQQLAYSTGGDANDQVRATMRYGHRRGAVSQATAARMNQDRALAAAKAGQQ